ncbi:MAG: thioredoxin domain-containing protein [Anaerolineaceae bacterium]|nr:thioredoxin domain-containing protein [Anaerolineaceae bacterium]
MTLSGKRKNDSKNSQMIIIVGILVVAVIAAGVAIFVSTNNSSLGLADIDYSEIPQSRTEDGAFVLGNEDAPVTFVLFEDFLCPHCQEYQPAVHDMIAGLVATGQAKMEFRMVQTNQVSYIPFSLAECANIIEPGSFWDAHDTMFELASARTFNENTPREFAEQMDIPYGDLLTCQPTATQYQVDGQFVQRFDWFTGTPAVGVRFNDGPVQQNALLSGRPTLPQFEQVVAMAQ